MSTALLGDSSAHHESSPPPFDPFWDTDGTLRDTHVIEILSPVMWLGVTVVFLVFGLLAVLADVYLTPYMGKPLFDPFGYGSRPQEELLPALKHGVPWIAAPIALVCGFVWFQRKPARAALSAEFSRLDNLALLSNDWQDEHLRRRWLEEARAQYPDDESLLVALNSKWKKQRARPFEDLAGLAAKHCGLSRARALHLLRCDADEPRKLLSLLTGRTISDVSS